MNTTDNRLTTAHEDAILAEQNAASAAALDALADAEVAKARSLEPIATSPKKITITMSESAPVTIDPEHWPLIAEADRHDGAVEVQANTEWAIRVREHDDGRRLVYGWECAGNGGKSAGYRGVRAGYLVAAGDDAIRAIRRVAGVIGDEQLGAECIADLPAVEL